jgi:hypothetical protein
VRHGISTEQYREKPEEFPEERAPITGRMLKKETTKASMVRWHLEWDQGETGRMTHGPVRGYSRRGRQVR